MLIESELQLREIYGHAKGRAKDKQLSALERHSINFIDHAPFMTLSTYAASGALDCSPRGGLPGFVKVVNENCIIIPDSKGNNRLDSLVNIIETKQFLKGEYHIQGEVWEVDDEVFGQLDGMEGYPEFYNRQVIHTTQGKAWMYFLEGAEYDKYKGIRGDNVFEEGDTLVWQR